MKQVATNKITFVDISVISKTNMWGLDKDGNAYQWDGATWAKKAHAVPFKEMSIGTDGAVFMVDAKGRIFTEQALVIEEPVKQEEKRPKELVQVEERKPTKKLNKKTMKKIVATKDLLESLEKQVKQLQTKKSSVQEKIEKLEAKKSEASGFLKVPIQSALDAQMETISTNQVKPIEERITFLKEEIDKQKVVLEQLEG